MDFNLYTVLEVSPVATSQEIKLAYKRLAVLYHPDKNPGNAQAEEKFKLISAAYQTLSNPTKRARYDQKLQYQREYQRRAQQHNPYYNPRYHTTRPPASVSERHYQSRSGQKRFSKKDLYITVTFTACLLLFSLLLKVVMDHVTGEDKYKTALSYIEGGKYSSAHSLLTDAIHFLPKHADAYLTRASLEMNVYENYAAAVRDINRAIVFKEDVKAETFYMRGKCHLKLENYRQAEADLLHALKMDSTLYAPYLELGELRLFYLKEPQVALGDFNAFLRHSNSGEKWVTALTYRGFGHYKLGNYEASEADYRQVLQQDQSNGRVFYLLGQTEMVQEQQDSACVHFNKAYRLGYSAALLELRANCL
ncbi:DnaJ domain-containing protein [Pontibacter qinzhouensis]|uniref:DnaJ domain-containing protein n=1 Tax=Pontibacter qinzhouensis TaxID=2603253 RepID=A0A5C8JIK8_9BACT|nr:J domain-containing protein [Pontibacter qinzhouensis]TXK36387.1 DnaJ domain-containing protein [Pontibacter qinzhouensis]